jgi:hypothetical protein
MKATRHLTRVLPGLLLLALAALLLRGYVTDDTFIHLRYAQHVAMRSEFSFNPGEHTYGSTSPLWVLGLVGLLKLGLPPLLSARVLGLLAGLLVVLLTAGFVARRPWPERWRVLVVLLVAADAWFLRWMMSGMETPLATALLLLLLWPLRASPVSGPGDQFAAAVGDRPAAAVDLRRWAGWGAAAGLAGLTRPEFLVLGPVALPWLLWARRWTRTGRVLLAAATGGLVVLGPWWIYAGIVFGRLLPETAAAKSYAPTLAPSVLLASLVRSASQLGATLGVLAVAIGLLLLLSRAGRSGEKAPGEGAAWLREERALLGVAISWTLVLAGGYAVRQVWVVSRYLSPLAPPLVLAGAGLAHQLLRRAPGSRCVLVQSILVLSVLGTLALNGWLLLAQVRPHAQAFARGVQECYLGTGRWLAEHSAPDAVVAALDIGAVGYASERRVLDLMGLVSPELLSLGRRMGFPAMVESGAWLAVTVPDYLVDRTEGAPRWVGRTVQGVHFTLLRSCEIAGVGLQEPQPWTVALYRLEREPGELPPVSPRPAP